MKTSTVAFRTFNEIKPVMPQKGHVIFNCRSAGTRGIAGTGKATGGDTCGTIMSLGHWPHVTIEPGMPVEVLNRA
jgi:hypothetical protein